MYPDSVDIGIDTTQAWHEGIVTHPIIGCASLFIHRCIHIFFYDTVMLLTGRHKDRRLQDQIPSFVIVIHYPWAWPTQNPRSLSRHFRTRVMHVASSLCTPAESQNAQPSLKIIAFSPWASAPVLWAIVTFVHSSILNLKLRSVRLFYVVLSLSQALSSTTLFNDPLSLDFSRSAHFKKMWKSELYYVHNNVMITSIISKVHDKRPRRMTTDMTAVECDQLHHTANPG